MAELDKIPQKQSIEIETVKIEESVLKTISDLNKTQSLLVTDFGSIYIRKKELNEEQKDMKEIVAKRQ